MRGGSEGWLLEARLHSGLHVQCAQESQALAGVNLTALPALTRRCAGLVQHRVQQQGAGPSVPQRRWAPWGGTLWWREVSCCLCCNLQAPAHNFSLLRAQRASQIHPSNHPPHRRPTPPCSHGLQQPRRLPAFSGAPVQVGVCCRGRAVLQGEGPASECAHVMLSWCAALLGILEWRWWAPPHLQRSRDMVSHGMAFICPAVISWCRWPLRRCACASSWCGSFAQMWRHRSRTPCRQAGRTAAGLVCSA